MNDSASEIIKEKIYNNRSWVEWAGRIGFVARGIVYILVGVLAFQAAFSVEKAGDGIEPALAKVAELPFGQILLVIIFVGLVCHAVWRFIQAIIDTDDKGSNAKGLLVRTAFVFVGIVYIMLAFSALRVLLTDADKADSETVIWTDLLLSQPHGQILTGIVGLVIIAIGIYQFFQTYSLNFRENLKVTSMTNDVEKWTLRLGRVGFIARGVVFSIIGSFFIFAAWNSSSSQNEVGLGSALRFIEMQYYGVWLLALTAAGLTAYGILMFFLARYRKMISNRE